MNKVFPKNSPKTIVSNGKNQIIVLKEIAKSSDSDDFSEIDDENIFETNLAESESFISDSDEEIMVSHENSDVEKKSNIIIKDSENKKFHCLSDEDLLSSYSLHSETPKKRIIRISKYNESPNGPYSNSYQYSSTTTLSSLHEKKKSKFISMTLDDDEYDNEEEDVMNSTDRRFLASDASSQIDTNISFYRLVDMNRGSKSNKFMGKVSVSSSSTNNNLSSDFTLDTSSYD